MNCIAVLQSSFVAAKDRVFPFIRVTEKVSDPIDVATWESRQTVAEWMINSLYMQR